MRAGTARGSPIARKANPNRRSIQFSVVRSSSAHSCGTASRPTATSSRISRHHNSHLIDGVIELAEFEEDLRRPIGRLLRQGLDELSGRLQFFFGRNLGRDEHVIGGRLSVLHDDRWLLAGVPGHAHAASIHEVGEVFPRGRTQGEPARLVHGGQPHRGDGPSWRLRRPEQPEHDRSSTFGDGDRLPRGRVDDLAGDESAADERERRQFDLLARQAFAAGHRDADAILRFGQEIVAPFRHARGESVRLRPRRQTDLAPFVNPPGRDHGSRGGLSGDAVRHGSRHHTTGRQRDDDIRRQRTRLAALSRGSPGAAR